MTARAPSPVDYENVARVRPCSSVALFYSRFFAGKHRFLKQKKAVSRGEPTEHTDDTEVFACFLFILLFATNSLAFALNVVAFCTNAVSSRAEVVQSCTGPVLSCAGAVRSDTEVVQSCITAVSPV